ncbi:MAG: hypothetical protein AB7F86_09330 [Bdellovibrionales bacterium]
MKFAGFVLGLGFLVLTPAQSYASNEADCAGALLSSMDIEKADESVTNKQVQLLRKNVTPLFDLLKDAYELPLVKVRLAQDNKDWSPRAFGFSARQQLVRLTHNYYNFFGERAPRHKTVGAQIHEVMHAILDKLAADLPVFQAIEALEREIKSQPKLAGEADTWQMFEGDHRKYYFEANLLFRLYSEFLCDVAAVVVTGDPHVIPANPPRSFNNNSYANLLEQWPDTPAVERPYVRTRDEAGRPLLSLGRFEPGYEPHVYLNPTRLFVWQNILYRLPRRKWKKAFQQIIKISLEEMNDQYLNPQHGYYKLSPRELNRRLMEKLKSVL